jgi:hypothetical protein
MIGGTVTHFHATGLSTADYLIGTIAEMRRHFDEIKIPQPPLPPDIGQYVNCEIAVTETEDEDGKRTGRITFTAPHGEVRYEREWVIAAARR